MKKIICFLLILVLSFSTLASCQKNDIDDDGDMPNGSNIQPDENYKSDALVYSLGDSEEDYFTNLFSPDVLVEISIDITDEQLALLQSDYEKYASFGSKSPIYRMADVTIKLTLPDGTVKERFIEEVGVRMKGNTSRTSFCSSDGGIYNQIHLKLKFGETFDDEEYYGDDAKTWSNSAERKARKKRTFATLEKLDLRWNKENDSTYIREIYSYDVFREAGVLAPHVNLSSLDFAGVHMGVYTVNEPVDEIFLEKNLPEKLLGGDLYKCGWGNNGGAAFTSTNSIGIEDEDTGAFYAYDLKTNKKTSTHETLKKFINKINNSTLTQEELETLIDVDYFLSFAAVSWFLGNPDDMRNNYNNYYVYFTTEGKAIFIPYDYDRAFGISHDWNPSGNGMTEDEPLAYMTALGQCQQNPLYLSTVIEGGFYTAEYISRLCELASSTLFSNARFNDRYNRAVALYSNYTSPSKKLNNSSDHLNAFDITVTADPSDTYGNISYSDYLALKYKTLNRALSDIDKKSEIYYIRADFTGWNIKDGYKLQNSGDGIYTYSLSVLSKRSLKIYDISRDDWLGQECVDKEKSADFSTDNNGNIVLKKGNYLITFYSNTKTIIIEETE